MHKVSSLTAAFLAATLLTTAALRSEVALPEAYGKILLDARLRYEFADQEGLEASHAATLRLRPGYQTPVWQGISALVEGEFTLPINGEANYDAYPGPQGTAGKTVIADGRTAELNRLQLSWSDEDNTVVVGRQSINLDNQRFVGAVGWRQNNQTFDAATLVSKIIPDTELIYSYAVRAQRVFGSEADNPLLRRLKGDIHVGHARYLGLPEWGEATAYIYHLDVDSVPSGSSNTAGMFFDGKHQIVEDWNLIYRAEYAHQFENGGSGPVDYGLNYWHFRVGAEWKGRELVVGYEELGSNGVMAVQTPLATLHAFNGWADQFLSTPAEGLRDYYLSLKSPVVDNLTAQLAGHYFESDCGGIHYGNELDAALTYKFSKQLSTTLKAAAYYGKAPSVSNPSLAADLYKVWVQMDYTY